MAWALGVWWGIFKQVWTILKYPDNGTGDAWVSVDNWGGC